MRIPIATMTIDNRPYNWMFTSLAGKVCVAVVYLLFTTIIFVAPFAHAEDFQSKSYLINNIAQVSYVAKNGRFVNSISNNVQVSVQTNAISTSALLVSKTVSAYQTGLDTYELNYSIVVKNESNAPVNAVRVIDNLDCLFAVNDNDSPIVKWTLTTPPRAANNRLKINRDYTGKANDSGFCDRGLLAMNAQQLQVSMSRLPTEKGLQLTDGQQGLQANQTEVINFTISVVSRSSVFDNTVTNTVFAAADNAVAIAHAKAIIPQQKPNIIVSKDVVRRGPFGANQSTYILDYSVQVANKTTVDANFVKVIDNLDCTFNMDKPRHLVKNWQIIAMPEVKNNATKDHDVNAIWLQANNEYLGHIRQQARDSKDRTQHHCDRELLSLTPEELTKPGRFPLYKELNLVDGVHYLKPNQSVTISYSVKVEIDNDFNVQSLDDKTLTNSVFVGTFYYNYHIEDRPTHGSGRSRRTNSQRNGYESGANVAIAAAAATSAATVVLDQKIDDGKGTLFLSKTSSKSIAELGDFVDYTVTLTNQSKQTLSGYDIVDTLPLGFSYENNSSALGSDPTNLKPVANPQRNGQNLTWSNNDVKIAVGDSITLRYRARIGVGATQGDGINHVTAGSGVLRSNEATARVQVTGGVFDEDSFIVGKVYLDCDGNRIQQGENEVGVPNIRVYLEDGTYAISDGEGKYSFYGIKPITHVLKLDNSTLPSGAVLLPLSNRHSGQGDSQFVDLKKGELHKADFAFAQACQNPALMENVKQRRTEAAKRTDNESDYILKNRMEAQGKILATGDVRGLPATGIVGQVGNSQQLANAQTFNPITPRDMVTPRPSALPERPVSKVPMVKLEDQMPKLDNNLGFVDLKDNDTLPIAQANVRVKGLLDSHFRLSVNGTEISTKRVGKRSKLAEKQMEGWEYVGVDFVAGKNTLKLEQLNADDKVTGEKTISLIAPDALGKLSLDLPAVAIADGKTPIQMKLHLTDNNGVPVTVRTQVTLETDQGQWETKDINPSETGTQIFVEGGTANIVLIPPNQPVDGIIRLSVGVIKKEVNIAYLPELRPLVGVGLLEGILNLRQLGNSQLNVAKQNDAFEKELGKIGDNKGDLKASGRAAFFFKGTVKGEYLLTAAYDSDKDTHQRLFRDIRPDQYYPIYGDSATKGFDAQSTNRMYVRIDKDKSYLLYGDYLTAGNTDVRQLTQYNRSLSGLKGHYENSFLNVTGFYSRDSSKQVVEEFPANGTSGPYTLSQINNNFIENSEKVEIIVRDLNQPSLVLASTPQMRFTDYTLDPLLKRIVFRGPVPSVDANLNRQYIRVIYETGSNGIGGMGGGAKFGIGGVDAQVKVTDNIQVGVIGVKDDNPENKAVLAGVTAAVKLGEKTVINGEFAYTETDLKGSDTAHRVQIVHDDGDLKAKAQYSKTGNNFSNQSSFINAGRTEIPATVEYTIDNDMRLKGEAIYSKDNVYGGDRKGIRASILMKLMEGLSGEFGMRASQDNGSLGSGACASYLTPITGNCMPTADSKIGEHIRNEFITVRGKLTQEIPWVTGLQTYIEAEQDVRDSSKHLFAVGANYQLTEKTRLFGRYQFMSTLGSPFAFTSANIQTPNNIGVVGIESAYMEGGNMFSEYRLRDGQSGREAQAALGLRNTWMLNDGLRVGAGFETTKSFNGLVGNDSMALVGSVEYFANPELKTSASLELRKADTSNSILNTLGLSYKINDDWSFLGRNIFTFMDNKDAGQTLLTRQQMGVAYREVKENNWNALARYEHKYEYITGSELDTNTDTHTHIVSAHVNYQANADVVLSGRYAAKLSTNSFDKTNSTYWAQLLYGRATWDFIKDWDVSVQTGGMLDKTGAMQYAAGAEIGYQVVNNLWLSVGYNVMGLHDVDLTANDYLDKGVYVRARFKFDENIFSW